jgi:hypothetical protein
MSRYDIAFSRHDLPELVRTFSSPKQREQGMPGARCTRGLACKVAQKNAHTSIQVQRRQSSIPCAMALRLMQCSPRRRIHLATVVRGLRLVQARLGRRVSAGLASATDARTTRFCRTQSAFAKASADKPVETSGIGESSAVVLRAVSHSQIKRSALRLPSRRRRRVHRILSRVRDDRDTPLLPGKDGASWYNRVARRVNRIIFRGRTGRLESP